MLERPAWAKRRACPFRCRPQGHAGAVPADRRDGGAGRGPGQLVPHQVSSTIAISLQYRHSAPIDFAALHACSGQGGLACAQHARSWRRWLSQGPGLALPLPVCPPRRISPPHVALISKAMLPCPAQARHPRHHPPRRVRLEALLSWSSAGAGAGKRTETLLLPDAGGGTELWVGAHERGHTGQFGLNGSWAMPPEAKPRWRVEDGQLPLLYSVCHGLHA